MMSFADKLADGTFVESGLLDDIAELEDNATAMQAALEAASGFITDWLVQTCGEAVFLASEPVLAQIDEVIGLVRGSNEPHQCN